MPPSLRLVSIALAGLLAFGCKARTFNKTRSAAVQSESGTGTELPLPVGVDPKLLTNLVPPEDAPRTDATADAIVQLPTGESFATLRGPDGKPLGRISDANAIRTQKWNVLDYEKILKKAHAVDASVIAPSPFAAKSVLSALRKVRNEFARRIEGIPDRVPNLLGERALLEALPQLSVVNVYETPNPARPFSTTWCGGYDLRDYSDVKWHYYCQIPGIFRACQRILAGLAYEKKAPPVMVKFNEKKLDAKEYSFELLLLRQADNEAVRSYCLEPTKFSDTDIKSIYELKVNDYEKKWKLAQGSLSRLFKMFHASQKDEATGVNMFDYIMRSGVYAWDYEQQQAVLNTFYGSLKPVDESPFDPSDPQDCKTYREPREERESSLGEKGLHCLASETRDLPFFVAPGGSR